MAFTWSNRPRAGDLITYAPFTEVNTNATTVRNSHCPSNCPANRGHSYNDYRPNYSNGSYCSCNSDNSKCGGDYGANGGYGCAFNCSKVSSYR